MVYKRLLKSNGLIIQWKFTTGNDSYLSSPVTFPITFTDVTYAVVISANGGGNVAWSEVGINNKTRTGFNCGTNLQSFIVIGY